MSCKISFSFWISMASNFKRTEIQLKLLTDMDMVLMVEKGIRERRSHAIHDYTKAS